MTAIAQLPFTPLAPNPKMVDTLAAWKRDILLSLACHQVATIESFNENKQTATATINYVKLFAQYRASTASYVQVPATYPVLLDCPVIFLGGGDCSLTFPVEEGDECLAFFNDRDFGNWFSGTTGAAPATTRLHSYADAILLVGVRSLPNVLGSFDMTRAVLRNGTTMVGVGAAKVKVANATTTLNTLLQNLMTTLNGTGGLVPILQTLITAMSTATGTTVPAQVATPSGVASGLLTTLATSLTTLSTQIGELLE